MNIPAQASHSLRDLGRLALVAARELDVRVQVPSADAPNVVRLANELNALFPGSRPLLPPESIGLVCDIIETWPEQTSEEKKDYDYVTRIAKDIADTLKKPSLSERETDRLIDICLALNRVSRREPVMPDIPVDHPYLVTFA